MTVIDRPEHADLVGSIAAQAARTPTATALIWRDQHISYGDLLARASAHRERVQALDLAKGEPVGILATKSPESIALILGALMARRPFLLPATSHPPTVLDKLFGQAGCSHILTPESARRATGPAQQRVLDNVSFLLTTSGSTGTPKIVPLSDSAVARFVAWAAARFEIGFGSRVLNYAPLSFDLCLFDIWATLARGGAVVLVDADDAVSGARLAALICDHEVRVVQAVPMLYSLLSGGGYGLRAMPRPVLPSVKHALFTGEAMAPGILATLPSIFPNARLYNLYGCTETNDSLLHEVDLTAALEGPIPIGLPLPGVQTLLVDNRQDIVEASGVGELWVSTAFQSSGYLGVGNSRRFGRHPDLPDGPEWFRSGDLVRRLPDGTLVLMGRNDLRVKVRGVGVDLGAVEGVLLQHPQVADAVVLAAPGALSSHRLIALVRQVPGSRLNTLALRRHCASRLPKGGIPEVMRVLDEPFPRNTHGKLDRAAVEHRYLITHDQKEA
jgi:non-ribosomal peptide synthetase component F